MKMLNIRKTNILKYIFFLFNCSMIFSVPVFKKNSKKRIICKLILFSFEIFINLAYICIGICQIIILHSKPRSVANSFMNFVTVMFRFVLSWKLKTLEKYSRKLTASQCIFCKDNKRKIWLYLLWIIYVVLSGIIQSIISFYANAVYNSAFSDFFFRSFDSETYLYASVSAYTISLWLFNIMPMHIFAIYYSFICCHLKNLLGNLIKTLQKVRIVDYPTLYKLTLDTEKIFYLENSNLDILVFIIVLLNGACTYHVITLIMYPKTYESYLHITTFFLLCSSTFICFFLMIASAVKVNDYSAEVSREIKKLPLNKNSNVTPQLQYFCMLQRDMDMKIWGIGSIKRSFIIAAFGTIFTYCILVDGIWASKK